MGTEVNLSALMLLLIARAAAEIRWTTRTLFVSNCEGQDQILMWNFSKGEDDTIRQIHWYYNQETLICYHSESTGFHVQDLYKDRVERNGATSILLKNLSSQDTGNYTLYPKLADEEKENVQTIRVTVYETPTLECKPTVKIHSKSIVSCSANHCGSPPFWIEWKISGIKEPVGNESFLKVNSSWNTNVLLCCPRGSIVQCHNGSWTDFCTPVSKSPSDQKLLLKDDLPFLNAPPHTDTTFSKCAIMGAIIPILSVMIFFLLAYILHKRRKQKLDQKLCKRNQNKNLYIVNNIKLEPGSFKGIFDSQCHLSTDVHTSRKDDIAGMTDDGDRISDADTNTDCGERLLICDSSPLVD